MKLGIVSIQGRIGLVFHKVRQVVNEDYKKQGNPECFHFEQAPSIMTR